MLILGNQSVAIEDFQQILFKGEKIKVAEQARERVENSFNFLETFFQEKIIYGINTGLGPMAQYMINDEDRVSLQYNAIRSHASGQGNNVDQLYVRSAMIVLLNNFLQGHSGIHPEVVDLLINMINNGITPAVPEHGSVGASGDLVQLAHIGLALIGEGEVYYKGELLPAGRVLKENNLKPVSVHIREGLSLINGTCFMTGLGMVNLMHSQNLFRWSVMACAMINEIVNTFDDSFSQELNSVKKHKGQNELALMMRNILSGSKRIRKREDLFYNNNNNHFDTKTRIDTKVQEYYSIRCVPQILGPIMETLEYSERILIEEANSSCDNPVIDVASRNIYHGGNFHGDYISLEMDKVKVCMTKLSMLMERQINYLMNDKLNGILPPFVNLGRLGVNFGMQGAQFTATSTTAENQTLSFPNYVHSIPNNNDNQDIVSMGTNSGLIAKRVIENAYQVLAIEYLCLVQAIDYLKISDQLSSRTTEAYNQIRKLVPRFEEDTIKYLEIKKIKDHLYTNFISL
jgi:histidine ammonia-lyase